MASTYSVNNNIELIATGEKSGQWGTITNTNLTIFDRLAGGVGEIDLTGLTEYTVTTLVATLSTGHYRVLHFTGTPSSTVTVTISPNDQQKVFLVRNSCGQSVTLTQGSGGDVTVTDGTGAIVYADGGGTGAEIVNLSALIPVDLGVASVTGTLAEFNAALSDATFASLAGTETLTNKTLTSPTITTPAISSAALTTPTITGTITEDVYALSGTTPTIEPDNGSVQTHTLSGNTTYTDGVGAGQAVTLMITDSGAYSITWPTITWVNNRGEAPLISTTDVNAILVWKVGSTLYGALVGNAI